MVALVFKSIRVIFLESSILIDQEHATYASIHPERPVPNRDYVKLVHMYETRHLDIVV
jgi:hypothetical protein